MGICLRVDTHCGHRSCGAKLWSPRNRRSLPPSLSCARWAAQGCSLHSLGKKGLNAGHSRKAGGRGKPPPLPIVPYDSFSTHNGVEGGAFIKASGWRVKIIEIKRGGDSQAREGFGSWEQSETAQVGPAAQGGRGWVPVSV